MSVRELCHEIKPCFDDLFINCYNRFDADNSVYWLTPTNENPSYKYAKLCFAPDERFCSVLLAGLALEKGLDPEYSTMFGKSQGKKLAMTPEWAWNDFMTDLSGEELPAALNSVEEKTGITPIVLVAGQYCVPGGDVFDPEKPRLKAEHIYFEAKSKDLSLIDYKPSPDQNPLNSLKQATTLSDLASMLETLPEKDFVWIDLLFALPIQVDPEASNNIKPIDLGKALGQFEKWVTP
jgi:hypothetical protein